MRDSNQLPENPYRAKQYKREKITYFIFGIVFSWITATLFILTGSSRRVADRTSSTVRNRYLGSSATVVVFMVLSWIVSFPLSYLSSHRLDHKYEMSNQNFLQWLGEQTKGFLVQIVLMIPVTQVMLEITKRRPRDWWAVLSLLSIPFTVVLAHLAPVLILPLFNRYEPLHDQVLADRLKRLAERSGIRVAEILEMDMSRQTKAANAFFTGIGSTKRIVLADNLINELTHEEIEAIVAHEIAHQAHRDLWRLLALGTISTAAIAWVTQKGFNIANRATSSRSGIRDAGYAEALPLLALVASVSGMFIMPLQNAVSRYIERQADDYALRHIEDPNAFSSALDKIASISLADPDPPQLEVLLLHSHPPIRDRRATAEKLANQRSAG